MLENCMVAVDYYDWTDGLDNYRCVPVDILNEVDKNVRKKNRTKNTLTLAHAHKPETKSECDCESQTIRFQHDGLNWERRPNST